MSQEPEEEAKPKININITYEGSSTTTNFTQRRTRLTRFVTDITVKARMNTKFGKIFDSVEVHTAFLMLATQNVADMLQNSAPPGW